MANSEADPERTPVIIGVGQINDRPAEGAVGLDSGELMLEALRRADKDAGGSVLADVDMLGVVDQISFPELGELCAPLAAAIGARPSVSYQSPSPHGDTPIRLLNGAANRIGAGEIKLAAVVGGEALRTAAARARARTQGGESIDVVRRSATQREPGYLQSFGLVAPVDIYPLYENASRASYGQSLAEAQAETGEIWSLFSQVAERNEGAWVRRRTSPEAILTPSEDNRPIAFPYNKLMVANSSVNQGAGFLVASLAEARRRGVPDEQLIYVGQGAAAKEPANLLRRDRFDRSVSMDVSIRATLAANGVSVQDLDLVELYSCFPCVPKMARRTLGWPADRPASVFGGLTFGGGPIGNYMGHAVVSMVTALRERGRFGFLFANGGFATDNHCILIGREAIAGARFPQDFDRQAEADAARGPAPDLDKAYVGPGRIETYTVFYGRNGSARGGVVIARTPAGARTLAHIDVRDPVALSYFTDGLLEPVGQAGAIVEHPELGRTWTLPH
ncbi:MAG TPA: acetyl-CoA acetyltransferase [Phenylobacterium sp.]|uniref:acetyl-CoA acetyltransferase n=1 Tax=Phenylobacterium sp. TaxID=1871053 RepID=UPI002B498B14|nr:acetyl-CoA acetyltransferase [Phenylobacterium sp.]HKR89630.1 acetyl-CoA acetyltransferase [Phenylobacterium sp.]